MKKINFFCTSGYCRYSCYGMVKGHVGPSHNEKLLKWSISAVLLPGKDDLVFDDTYSVVDCARNGDVFLECFAPYSSIQLAFPTLFAKLPFLFEKSLSSLRGTPTCWLFCDAVGWTFSLPASPPPPGSLWLALTFVSKLGEAGRAVLGMWPPYVENWSLGGWLCTIYPFCRDDGHPPSHTPPEFPTASAENLDPDKMISSQGLYLLHGMLTTKAALLRVLSQSLLLGPSLLLLLLIVYRDVPCETGIWVNQNC